MLWGAALVWEDFISEEDDEGEGEEEDGRGVFDRGGVILLETNQGFTCHSSVGEDEDDDERENEGEVVNEEVGDSVCSALLDLVYDVSVNLARAGKFSNRNDDACDEGCDDEVT